MILHTPSSFSLEKTLFCGQCFRWTKEGEGYRGIACHREWRIREEGHSKWYIEGAEEGDRQLLEHYFDLRRDYEGMMKELSGKAERLDEAIEYSKGIRILNQEPFEALCTFILSQNNHIPRIKGIVERLCQHFGKALDGGGHDFPEASRLAGLEKGDLTPIRAGFRAGYLIDGARKVASGEIEWEELRTMPLEGAKERLMGIRGVGPKVAACVLLYGLHRLDAFPEDVWIKRAMNTFLPTTTREDLGSYAGVAQQWLYHYSRDHRNEFKKSS